MKRTTFLLSTLVIWVVAAGSLVVVRHFVRKAPRASEFARGASTLFDTLDSDTKRNISVCEAAIMRFKDGTIRVIGAGYEPEIQALISKRQLLTRTIDFVVPNPLEIERKMMSGEAFKILNDAEKRCLADGFGAIIFQNGSYHFCCDEAIYREYVLKYGTDCKPCEEQKRSSQDAK